MEIYLIRHTKTTVPEGVCYGNSDVDLGENYLSEFIPIKKRLTLPLNVIYSSPLVRCRLLTQSLSATKEVYDPRLQELNFGDWEGKTWNSIDKIDLDNWMKNFVEEKCPNGESYQNLISRVKEFWEELLLSGNQNIAIVSHGGVIRTILCLVLGIPFDKAFSIKIAFGSITQIQYSKGYYSINYINRI